jgi:hypothetical protein
LPEREPLRQVLLTLRGLAPGEYCVQQWNTLEGCAHGCIHVAVGEDKILQVVLPFLHNDLALAVGCCHHADE